jgi:hypothetical protein
MGTFDSSLTRVQPVFDHLYRSDPTGGSWLERLLSLPAYGNPLQLPEGCKPEITAHHWGKSEKKLDPPVALLSWLVRHPEHLSHHDLTSSSETDEKRRKLIGGSREQREEALRLLRHNPFNERWHIFEGEMQPDVFIETDDIVVVIEGKRTERTPTTDTTWMKGRHQMLRHLDCAFEAYGDKRLLGFFIVEGNGASPEVPEEWVRFARETTSPETVSLSLPHRGPEEQHQIASAFLGVTTWQRVCKEFDLHWRSLPGTKSRPVRDFIGWALEQVEKIMKN